MKISVNNGSELNSVRLCAGSDISIEGSRVLNNSSLAADRDLLVKNSSVEGNAVIYAGNLAQIMSLSVRNADVTGNSLSLYNARLTDSSIDLKNNLTVTKGSELSNVNAINHGELNIGGNSRVNNSTLTAQVGANLDNAYFISTDLMTKGSVFAKNSTFENNSSVISNDGDISISGSNINNRTDVKTQKELKVENSNVLSVGDMNISGTNTLTNSRLFTNKKLFAEGLIADNNSFVGAEDTARIEKATFNNSSVYAKNYLILKSNNINNSYVSSNDIEIGKSDVKNSRFSAKRHLSFYDHSTAENITADYFQSISVTTDSKITNSNLRLGYLLLDGVVAENVSADAKYDLKYFNSELQCDYITATAKQNILIGNVTNNSNITMNGGNIIINNSNFGNANITSTLKGLSMASSEADSLTVSGQGNVLIYDTIVNNDLKIMNNDGVELVGDYVGGNTTVENVANVYIKSSDSESSNNNGNHYSWENGNNGNNGNYYGWNKGHSYGSDYDNVGWGDSPRDDHFSGKMTHPTYWDWGRPEEDFHGSHGFDRSFLAYWNNFMFGNF